GWLVGWVVMVGAAVTVRVATLVVALPALLVKMASYSSPFMSAVTLDSVSVALVAPPMAFQVVPPSVLTSHCTVGVGLPLAAAVNGTLGPAVAGALGGEVVRVARAARGRVGGGGGDGGGGGGGGGAAGTFGEDGFVLVTVHGGGDVGQR